MQLFFAADLEPGSGQYTFSKEESKHLVKVLRKSVGDSLHITNGEGWLFEAELLSNDPKGSKVEILQSKKSEKHPYYLHMAVAPTKMNDRFEWFIEKATEIGVDEITPIICDRSERRLIKPDRLRKIALTAMKQSMGSYLPKINNQLPFEAFLKNNPGGKGCIAHCLDDHKGHLSKTIKAGEALTILIGPEGDFTVKEIEMALAQDYIPVNLGKKRLRTETAAIVSCATVSLINE